MAFDIDTTSPSDSQIISTFPGTQRDIHGEIKDIITAEHIEGTGKHNIPVVADETALLALTDQNDGMIVGQTDIATLMQRQAGSFISLNGTVYIAAADVAALDTTALSEGHLLVESDTLRLYFWDSADWIHVSPGDSWIEMDTATSADQSSSVAEAWMEIVGTYNGNTQLGVDIVCPDDGRDYEIFAHGIVEIGCNNNENYAAARMTEEDSGGGGAVEKRSKMLSWFGAGTKGNNAAHLFYHNDAPTNGNTYSYICQWAVGHHGSDRLILNPSDTYLGESDGVFSGIDNFSQLIVSIKPRET